jgi:hypothetical protein
MTAGDDIKTFLHVFFVSCWLLVVVVVVDLLLFLMLMMMCLVGVFGREYDSSICNCYDGTVCVQLHIHFS